MAKNNSRLIFLSFCQISFSSVSFLDSISVGRRLLEEKTWTPTGFCLESGRQSFWHFFHSQVQAINHVLPKSFIVKVGVCRRLRGRRTRHTSFPLGRREGDREAEEISSSVKTTSMEIMDILSLLILPVNMKYCCTSRSLGTLLLQTQKGLPVGLILRTHWH